jgi:hypothetical protein
MTITAVSRDIPGIYRPVSYVPGSVRFTYAASERRTETYRTWQGRQDMGWCAECLLCGQWESSHATRAAAIEWATGNHPGWCHVVQGCHCPQPHITAAMAARLGLGADYPRHLATVLFKLAGGRRKYHPPHLDRYGTPFGASEGTYYYWR